MDYNFWDDRTHEVEINPSKDVVIIRMENVFPMVDAVTEEVPD